MNQLSKIKFSQPVTAPDFLGTSERAFHDDHRDACDIVLLSINPWHADLADAEDARLAAAAQESIRQGDVSTARALACDVLLRHPSYFFMHTVLNEANALAGASTEERLRDGSEAIEFLQKLGLGLVELPDTIEPLAPEAFWFETANHLYNLGDDLCTKAMESDDASWYREAARHFRLSLSSLPAIDDPRAAVACQHMRMAREAAAWACFGDEDRCRAILERCIVIAPRFTRAMLERSLDYSNALRILDTLTEGA